MVAGLASNHIQVFTVMRRTMYIAQYSGVGFYVDSFYVFPRVRWSRGLHP